MLFLSLYTTSPSSSSLTAFAAIEASDTENSSMCNMDIFGFSPMTVNGGTGDIVTITGQFFGQPGTVQLRNADDGGTTWITLDSYDIISWTPSEIQIRIPSTLPLDATNVNQLRTPGSGKIRILTNTMDSKETNSDLVIYYSWNNYNAPFSNLKSPYVFAGINDVPDEDGQAQAPGYRIVPHPNIANNNAALESIATAMRQWTCETGIRWELATNETTTSTSIQDNISSIRFGPTSNSTRIGETAVRVVRCDPPVGIEDLGFAAEFDIVISDAANHPFFFDHTGLVDQPVGLYDFHSVVLHELGHAHLLRHINHEADLMSWKVLPNNAQVANFNRKISLSPSNVDGGSVIMEHSAGMDYGSCQFHDDAIVPLDLINCNFAMNIASSGKPKVSKLKAFPNPTNGKTTIEFTSGVAGVVQIIIFNTLGQPSTEMQKLDCFIGLNRHVIDLSNLSPGLHFIYVNGENYFLPTKLVVE